MTRKALLLGLCLCLLGWLNSCGPQQAAENYFEQGKKAYEKKDFALALTNYNEAIKLNPKMGKAYNNRGIVGVATGKLNEAIADFTKAIELDPKNGKAYNNRAVAYYYTGDVAKSRADALKAQGLGIAIKPQMLEKLPKPPGGSK
jgi:Flp pilus assembly protein TadD